MPFAGLFARLRGSYTHIRLAILVTLLFTVLVATIFRTPSIIFMAALFFAAPLMGILAGGFLSRGLSVSRAVPETGSVGDIVSGRLSVSNRSSLPAFLIHLRPGGTPDVAPHESSLNDNTAAIEGQTNSGRQTRAPHETTSEPDARTPDMAKMKAGNVAVPSPIVLLGQEETIVPLLRAGERLEWAPQWRLQRRGVHRLPPARAGANDPLGLFSALNARTAMHEITVLPRPLRVERLSFLGGSQANPRTPQHAAVVAEALDFHGVRAWRPGEAIRRVHWKSTARTGALHVVEWEESLGRDLTLLLDARSFQALTTAARSPIADTGRNDSTVARKKPANPSTLGAPVYDEAFEAAVTLVASIAAHLLEGGHRCQLFCWQSASETTASAASSQAATRGARANADRANKNREDANREDALPKNAAVDALSSRSSDARAGSAMGAPVLCRHLARGAGDLGDTLKMLARLEALPDTAAFAPATMAHLAMQATSLLGRGDSVLLLASTLSDLGATVDKLQPASASAHALQIIALDAASFQSSTDAVPATAGSVLRGSVQAPLVPHAMRVVRRGDSLAAALERE